MNQINQFLQQMRTLFAGMTPQSKLMAILLTVGIAISSVFLVQGATTSSGATVHILGGRALSDEELDNIEFALSKAALREFQRDGKRIRVPKASLDLYMKAISDGKANPLGMGNAMDSALNSNSLMESSLSTQAKLQNGKKKDLENAIKRMDPIIVDAIITPDESRLGFSGDRKKTASIAIQTRGNKDLTADQRRGIIDFVQKSYAGLRQSDIALFCNGNTTIVSDDPTEMQQSKFYLIKRQQEQNYRERAERLLADYGNVRLDVNVELDPIASEETESISFNEKPTKIQSASTKRDAKSSRGTPGGRPGTQPNAIKPNEGQSLAQQDQSSETKEQTESEKSVTGNTLKKTETVGHQTTRVSVSISIPFSYYLKAAAYKWQQLNPKKPSSEMPELTPAELETLRTDTERKIQSLINGILPTVAAGEDKFPRVFVDSYPDFPVAEPPAATLAETSIAWLSQSWQTLALFGIVLAALLSLRSFAKTVPTANDRDFERGFDLPLDDATDIDLTSLTDEENAEFDSQEEAENAPPRLRTTGGDIKNDLTAVVRENPSAAATILRNWITESI